MPDTIPRKAQLRDTLRQRRQALSAQQQSAAAQSLTTSITQLPSWFAARRIALYMAADGEIDTGPLKDLARQQAKELYLPVITSDKSLRFHAWQAGEQLLSNDYGIPEPATQARRCPAAQLDIIFLPLVGWDRHGGRLGMGGGFYDRTLAGVSGPLLVGLAHDCQEIDGIPRDSWDVSLAFIVTNTALHYCQEAEGS